MATVNDLLAWARAQLGTVEGGGPHGNDGNIVVYWDQIHHHGLQGCPWCAAFVEAGEEAVGVPVIVDSQYCPTIEAAFARAGRLFPVAQAQPGDQAFFHFPGEANEANHTGLVETVDPAAQTVTCIEGNTSSGAAGSQSNGGGVYRRTRPWSQVRDVGRPTYTAALPAPAPVVAALPVLPTITLFRGSLGGKPVSLKRVFIPTDAVGDGDAPAPVGFLGVSNWAANDKYDQTVHDASDIIVPVAVRESGEAPSGYLLVVKAGPANAQVPAYCSVSDG